MMRYGLRRAVAHLLPLTAARRCLLLRLLAVMLPETDVHVLLDIGCMGHNIVYHALLNGPTEEVKLAHGRLLNGGLPADLETDALTTAEGVEQTLGVRLEFALVVEVDHEGAILQRVADVELLGVVRHEPVDQAETDGRFALQDGEDRLQSPRLVVEILEPADDEILLALNAALERLTGCLDCLHWESEDFHLLRMRVLWRFKWTQDQSHRRLKRLWVE
jgi:hypothetical protein